MEFRQIKYFMEVAKREHVTEAADALHVAQSAVSRQIANLESELGVDLFIRKGRRVKLTPIGKMFFDRMKQAMNVIDNARLEVKEYLDPEQGTIRIAFPISMAAYTLPSVIVAFRKRYPNVKFQLKQAVYHELIEGVIDGDFNMALIGPVPNKHRKVKSQILFTENVVALLPVNHLLANKQTLTLNELQEESFILLPKGFILRDLVVQACHDSGFKPQVSFEGDDIDALKGLVSAGLGITLIPEITLVDNLPHATIKIPISEPVITRTVGILVSNERQLLPAEKLFYEFLTDFFQEKNV
ncbi:LysR family transcriptional regulator [Alkalihalobacillus alcalophilus ATCC 27647 = CGMCC 1.3604]|uniref:LysR family transcriptional regulator n=1 Tax=Alkalihalobacillus alcalophilus ATCC 27647 = CGMCC 1.3604 TaxID=1218173 RepID=A0A094WPN9_ALKAL|nr:LysR family transcriptional regulator [Alkalihalobacillus alcalophilus]KGA97998.1 LysR family transcriptional regulator [Alkalihalobacillus alcalophilus ATCC 27647 = CGMCC 1.3604]MED1561880.1 LysR family transcriptional regulator [Alkalihalobacillus alcalophilus]THG90447.1 LysR family transcriptional regulator [Alkalihalobacillus alcalophilus ATCC 27647 = CGMCC 1.3604]